MKGAKLTQNHRPKTALEKRTVFLRDSKGDQVQTEELPRAYATMDAVLARFEYSMRLFLLGQTVLTDGTTLLEPRPTRKILSLIAYLAVHKGCSLDRSMVAADLWPEKPSKAARESLRSALAVARKHLPENALRVDASSVGLVESSLAWDGEDFDDIETWAGEFMPGFDDPWIMQFREEFREKALAIGLRDADRALKAGDVEQAAHTLSKCCEIDPLSDRAARRLVSCLNTLDRKAEAASRADRFSKQAMRELGIATDVRACHVPDTNHPLVDTCEWLLLRDPAAALDFIIATRSQWVTMPAQTAVALHSRVLESSRIDSPTWRLGEAQFLYLQWIAGHFPEFMSKARVALNIAEPNGETETASVLHTALAFGHLSQGNFKAAMVHAKRDVELLTKRGDAREKALAEITIAIVQQHAGNEQRFDKLVVGAARKLSEIGSVHDQATVGSCMGNVHRHNGRLDLASERIAVSKAYFQASGGTRQYLWARLSEAQLLLDSEQFEKSKAVLASIRSQGIETAGHSLIALVDDHLAVVDCSLKEYDSSALALARASVLRSRLGTVPSVLERRDTRQARSVVRDRLDKREIRSAFLKATAEAIA